MGDVYAASLLVEQAEWERQQFGDDRKAIVARLFIDRYLADKGRLRGIDEPRSAELDRFDELLAGALADDRAP
jgi:hypothetical protein